MSEQSITRLLDLLKSQPSTNQLQSTLFEINNLTSQQTGRTKDLIQLTTSRTLLEYTIPETYLLIDNGIKSIIYSILSNRIALYQLISKINADLSNIVYCKILADLVDSPHFANIFSKLNEQSSQEFRDLEKLVTVKIPEALNKCYLHHKTEDLEKITVRYYKVVFIYILKIQRQSVSSLLKIAKMIDLLCLGDPKLVDGFFNNIKIHRMLCDIYSKIPTDWKFVKLLIKHMSNCLDDIDLCMNAYYLILSDLSYNQCKTLLEYASTIGHFPSSKVLLALSSRALKAQNKQEIFYEYLQRCVIKFGSKCYIEETSTITQQFFTKFLICLAQYCTNKQLNSLSHYSPFIDAISNRLDSQLNSTRQLGMFFADFIYGKTKMDGSVLFEIEDIQSQEKEFFGAVKPIIIYVDEKMHNSSEAISFLSNRKSHPNKLIPTIALSDDHFEVTHKIYQQKEVKANDVADISIPVYLKELLSYMNADPQTDKLADKKKDVVFAIAPRMIRSKANTPELEYYSKFLLENIIAMSNTTDSPDFSTWKLSTMIALNVSDFDTCSEVSIKAFVKGDISMSSRLMILTSLSLSCREITGGYNDNFVKGKDHIEEFSPKKLPESLHRQFMQYEGLDSPFQKSSDNLLALNSNMEALHVDGKIVRMSSTLKNRLNDSNKRNLEVSQKNKDTSFINKKLPQLFYSLIGVWETINSFTGSGFKLGTFSIIINAEYFRNLCLVYKCAIPSSIELSEMTKNILLLISKGLKQLAINGKVNQDELSSLLDCIKAVLEVDDSVLQLTGLFMDVLYDIYGQIGQLVEDDLIVDEECQGKCAHVINKLRNLVF